MAVALIALAAVACRQDMHDQPKYTPFRASTFFADQTSSRPLIPGTVARGQLRADAEFYLGKTGEDPVTEFPIPITADIMARGQQMFDTFCSPCHGRTGVGDGMVVQRGFSHPPSLVDARLRDLPPGHFFEVITNGFGAMPDHAAQIPVEDRWAIIAYIRALQLSASATLADVPDAERRKLEAAQQ
jgi:mono/diheme cytochrome c family protein